MTDQEAEAHLKTAIELDPTDVVAPHELGLLYLRTGRWVDGLILLQQPGVHKMPPMNPWSGENLDNKSICIHATMGIGDRFSTVDT